MSSEGRGRAGTILLCFLAALLEGVDIQSMGLAAPRLAPEFGLSPAQVGYAATASVVGLFLGAVVGGRLADRIGRKAVLLGSLAALGVFSLGTALSHDLGGLIVLRVLTGLGMGGAFPNLIAIAAEAAGPRSRATAISLMYCGMPFGGAIAGLLVYFGGAGLDWRAVFYLGGFGPLALVPLMLLALPESSRFRQAWAEQGGVRASVGEALFGEGRAPATLLLWASFFFTLLVVYLLLNWIPSLMIGKGLSRSEGALVSAVLNAGAVIGSLVLAWMMDLGRTRLVVPLMYVGMAVSLAALAYLQGFAMMAVAGFAAGFFAIGGQLVLYALAPSRYGVLIRGTGVGAAVAVGRGGSICGPLMGGALLAAGYGAPAVLGAAVPGLLVAGFAAAMLLARPEPVD